MNKKIFAVGIYLRLSQEDKNKQNMEDPSESIKNQRNMLIDYINKRPEFSLVDEYCDEDLSGAGTYRPEFERLIKDCENKKLDIVLCKSQSRFSRDMEIIEKYLNNKFKEWNIRFIGIADNADTNNNGNKKARQINGLVNEWYLEDVSNNIRTAFFSKMKQGEFISPFAAFGYEISPYDNNKLIIDPVASEIVKSIYNLYLRGLGLTRIAKYLNENNIPSPSFYKYQKGIKLNIVSNKPRNQIKWSSNAIKKILTNELYLGHLVQGKRTTVSYKNHKIIKKKKEDWIIVKNTHEAIITEDLFLKVQTAIKKHTKSVKKTGCVHNFSGKVFCRECGSTMRKKNSCKYEYLVCSNNKDGYNECKNKVSIRYDKLEEIILNKINLIIKNYYDANLLNNFFEKDSFNKNIDNYNRMEKELKNKIIKNKTYLKNLYEDKINNIINLEQFKDLIFTYNMENDNLKKQLKVITEKKLHHKDNLKFSDIFSLDKLNRIIVDEFIDKIYIGEKKGNERDVKIIWNF